MYIQSSSLHPPIYNGNTSKSDFKLKLFYWNKGSSKFINRISEIQILIQKYDPHVLSIVEANVHDDLSDITCNFPGYNFELTKMHQQIKLSRNILMIKQQIN